MLAEMMAKCLNPNGNNIDLRASPVVYKALGDKTHPFKFDTQKYDLGDYEVEVDPYSKYEYMGRMVSFCSGHFYKKDSVNKYVYPQILGYGKEGDVLSAFNKFENDLVSVLIENPSPNQDYNPRKIREIAIIVQEKGLDEAEKYYQDIKSKTRVKE